MEIILDGIVCLYCLKNDQDYDADEITWEVQKVSSEGVILCIIIEDVHQIISYCLIPLDP